MNSDKNGINEYVLNIAAIAPRTKALGPGTRAAVWVQGCPLNCPGCIAPNWIPFKAATILSPNEILSKLDLEILDGLTFSGGEPMEQAAALAILVKLIRKEKNLSLICFTGYRYERLIRTPPNKGVEALLSEVDVLIDGPYIQAQNDSIGLRGSANQRIIHLTPRLQDHMLDSQKRSMEVTITDGELTFIGIPTPGMRTAMDHASKAVAERKNTDEWL
jgi:anaerobic ribonucleoside-triphosphate reductase activating protein